MTTGGVAAVLTMTVKFVLRLSAIEMFGLGRFDLTLISEALMHTKTEHPLQAVGSTDMLATLIHTLLR